MSVTACDCQDLPRFRLSLRELEMLGIAWDILGYLGISWDQRIRWWMKFRHCFDVLTVLTFLVLCESESPGAGVPVPERAAMGSIWRLYSSVAQTTSDDSVMTLVNELFSAVSFATCA